MMYPSDEVHTSFITDHANFCYRMIPFDLKNAGATYQRLMDKVFHQQIGQNMEVYVYDMVVKTASAEGHAADLAEVFSQIKKHNMRLNPEKCIFGVQGGKFLGFMITARGIEANPDDRLWPRPRNPRGDDVNSVCSSLVINRSPVSELIRVEPCQPGERVYMPCIVNTPFFYMYRCFFRYLGVCLPFNEFECRFLRFINVTPCQLHPNSWGFLLAFQVLCSALGMNASLPVFLHFYQLKLGEPPLGWVSLSGSKAGGVFQLYS
uniref:Retrovirus-related Pol polyprotein from transposon 17.6 n=1 Tax=Cajanus cajan TaxID=3821 RepID=A0A151TBU1_CAJCA|nr:Retrovirus-related Pol polyprotein from transposon 17.6 [Cajanus cajan]